MFNQSAIVVIGQFDATSVTPTVQFDGQWEVRKDCFGFGFSVNKNKYGRLVARKGNGFLVLVNSRRTEARVI